MAEQARKRASRKASTATVQAAVEGVVEHDGKVEFMGAYFQMAENIGLMPLLKFAHASSQGLDSNDMEGLAALYSMLQDCIDPGIEGDPENGVESTLGREWKRFERHAITTKAEADDLMAMVQKVIEVISSRPSRRPGGSSPGPQRTLASSKDSSLTEGMTSVQDLDR